MPNQKDFKVKLYKLVFIAFPLLSLTSAVYGLGWVAFREAESYYPAKIYESLKLTNAVGMMVITIIIVALLVNGTHSFSVSSVNCNLSPWFTGYIYSHCNLSPWFKKLYI